MELQEPGRIERYRSEVTRAFTEKHSPRATAASFALGAFIVLMPTSGTGLLIFAGIALISSQVNRVALFSTAAVFNPAVKVLFYGLSYFAGGVVLGKAPALGGLTFQALTSLGASMIVGSLVVATLTSAVSYAAVYRLAAAYR